MNDDALIIFSPAQVAIKRYDAVLQALELARELQKQFQQIGVDVSISKNAIPWICQRLHLLRKPFLWKANLGCYIALQYYNHTCPEWKKKILVWFWMACFDALNGWLVIKSKATKNLLVVSILWDWWTCQVLSNFGVDVYNIVCSSFGSAEPASSYSYRVPCSLSVPQVDKMAKKQAKRQKLERQDQEQRKVREILRLQSLLDSMGSENVRSDFQEGKHGAIQLSEDNLNQLDELYKLISPTRDGETE